MDMERGRTGNLAPIAGATRATPPTTKCDPPSTPYEVQGGFRIIRETCMRACVFGSAGCPVIALITASETTLRFVNQAVNNARYPRYLRFASMSHGRRAKIYRRDPLRFQTFRVPRSKPNKGGRANRHTFPKVALPPQRVLWNTKEKASHGNEAEAII